MDFAGLLEIEMDINGVHWICRRFRGEFDFEADGVIAVPPPMVYDILTEEYFRVDKSSSSTARRTGKDDPEA